MGLTKVQVRRRTANTLFSVIFGVLRYRVILIRLLT